MPGFTDSTFLRELFLQRLPANARMVLASTREDTSIEELAQLADRIIEVAVPPSVSNVSSQPSELDLLKAEITSLTQVVNSLRRNYRSNCRSRYSSNRHHSQVQLDDRTHPPNSLMFALVSLELQRFCTQMHTSLLQVGKRSGQTLMVTSMPGLLTSRLFYITDCSNGFRFLVDTGPEVSVILPSATDKKHRQDTV